MEAYRDKLRKRNRVITNIIQFNTKDDAHFSPRGDPILDDELIVDSFVGRPLS